MGAALGISGREYLARYLMGDVANVSLAMRNAVGQGASPEELETLAKAQAILVRTLVQSGLVIEERRFVQVEALGGDEYEWLDDTGTDELVMGDGTTGVLQRGMRDDRTRPRERKRRR